MRCCAAMRARLVSAESQAQLQSFQQLVEEAFPKASVDIARTITASYL